MPGKIQIAAGIDAGHTSTRCMVFALDDMQVRYLGHGEAPSAGWHRGRIADQEALAACMQSAVRQAETHAGVPVDAVVLGIGGTGVDGYHNHGTYEFGRPREVRQEDINYAIDRAANVRMEDDRCLLQVLPQDFTLNGRAGYRNPRGTVCKRLEANVYIITAPVQDHDLLIAAAHQAHLSVEETVFNPIAAAYAAVLPEDRSRGVAVVDVGATSTDMVIYEGDAVVHARSLAISADHFTRDVKVGLKTSYDDAERLKIEYGCAILGLTADNSIIEVPAPEGKPPREAPRKFLNDILEARAEELFYNIRNEMTRIGLENNDLESILLVGGGALLNGMCDMAERMLNCQARNGLPMGIDSLPEELESPTWTTAAGLAMYSARLKLNGEEKRKAPGLLGLVMK